MKTLFDKEQKVFEKNRSKWLKMRMDNLVVIIKDDEVLGFAGSMEEAYAKGLDLIGNQEMFLKEII